MPLYVEWVWVFAFGLVFGLIVGSFLNVCIYRLPLGQSVVTPRSHCPNCGRFIRWFDNIPIVSYLLLRGRCRSCKKPISIQYPLVELATGLLSVAVRLKFPGWGPYLCFFVLLTAPLVAITVIDFRHKIIPDLFTLPGIAAGLLVSVLVGSGPFAVPAQTLLLPSGSIATRLLASSIGILAGGGTLFAVSWLYEKIRGQPGIGMGDVKLAAMLGAFFGWKGVFLTLFLSSFLGSVAGVGLMVFFRKGLKFEIPYGPFIAAGALLNLFFGSEIVTAYLKITGFVR